MMPSILLVDDDEGDAEFVLRAFRKYKVANPLIYAPDGVSALEILGGKPGATPLPTP